MGMLDVQIDLIRQSRWKKRHMFISNLQQQQPHQFDKQSSSSTAVNHELNHFMNNDLYWAAAGAASPDKFDQILKNSNSTRAEEDVFVNNVIRCVSPVGNTVLHVAAAHGNVAILIHICSLNPSLILSRNCNGDTPLHLAAGAGHLDVVVKLITAMKSFYYDSENKLGWRQVSDFEGLHGSRYESENWHGTELAEPIYKEEMLRMKNEQGNTAMHTALISFNEEIALFLVQVDPGTMFCLNNDDKSGWYLAVEAGYTKLIKELLEIYDDEIHLYEMIKGKPPVHAAVSLKQMDAVRVLVDKEPRLVNLRDEEGKTPLHIAAFNGHLDGVTYMLGRNATAAVVKDSFGFFPIHWAAIHGHVHVVHELLTQLPDPVEIVDNKCRNILHIAAESGRNNVVIYILKNPACKKLINAKDVDGNTPLHLATFNWHTRIVTALVRNVYTDLNQTNNDGETALDAVEVFEKGITCYQQRLTWTALLAAGAKRAPQKYYQNLTKQPSESSRPTSNKNMYKDRVNTLLVVATLIATITFAAGFTLPGGYSSSGQATLLGNKVFSLFIFCDTISMYCAMAVTIFMIWAQLGDLNLVLIALRLGLPLLALSLTMMSIAFMAGVYPAVSHLQWLAHSVVIMGTVFFIGLSALSFPLWFPISSKIPIVRSISYCVFHLLLYLTESKTRKILG